MAECEKDSDLSDGIVDMHIVECSGDEENEIFSQVPTKNRFDGQQSGRGSEWKTVRRAKRKKVSSSGSMGSSSFDDLSNSDKLSRLLETVVSNQEMLTHISNEQSRYHRVTEDLQADIKRLNKRAEVAERKVDKQAHIIKTLAYRSIDTEARSRRNNVIIWGVSERSNMSMENLVFGFIEDELDVNVSDMVIDRAHRMGSKATQSGNDPKRPIIVRFRDFNDVETIMRRAYKLKGTQFGLDRDYPMEIAEARKELYKSRAAQEARRDRNKIQIRYPAKLYINGTLVKDQFPEWQNILKGDRVACFQDDGCKQHTDDKHKDQRNPEQSEYTKETDVNRNSESSSGSESVVKSVKTREIANENIKTSASVKCNNNASVMSTASRDSSNTITNVVNKEKNKGSPAVETSREKSHASSQGVKSVKQTDNSTKSAQNNTNLNTKACGVHNTVSESSTHTQTQQNEQSINRPGENREMDNRVASNNDNITHL